MEIVQLKACDYEAGTDFLDLVFSKNHAYFDFRNMIPVIYRPTDQHMSCNYAIRENDSIRAIVGLFPAQIQVGNQTLKLGGIGGVSSHPNDRGKGWMKLLMNRCIEEMKNTDVDLSFLTGLRQRYQYFGYEKSGTLIEHDINQTNMRHVFKDFTPQSDLHFVPVTESDLSYLEQMKSLHDGQPFYCIRPLSDFYLYLVSMSRKPWVALYPNGDVAGYLVTNEKQDLITEIFAQNDTVFLEMIYHWFSQQQIPGTRVTLTLWQSNYSRILCGISEKCNVISNGSWRIFNWEKVVGTLLALKHSQSNLIEGSLLIGIKDYGTLSIKVANGTTECKKVAQPADIEWDPLMATRILFGHVPANLITEIPQALQPLVASWLPLPLCWLIQNYV